MDMKRFLDNYEAYAYSEYRHGMDYTKNFMVLLRHKQTEKSVIVYTTKPWREYMGRMVEWRKDRNFYRIEETIVLQIPKSVRNEYSVGAESRVKFRLTNDLNLLVKDDTYGKWYEVGENDVYQYEGIVVNDVKFDKLVLKF